MHPNLLRIAIRLNKAAAVFFLDKLPRHANKDSLRMKGLFEQILDRPLAIGVAIARNLDEDSWLLRRLRAPLNFPLHPASFGCFLKKPAIEIRGCKPALVSTRDNTCCASGAIKTSRFGLGKMHCANPGVNVRLVSFRSSIHEACAPRILS